MAAWTCSVCNWVNREYSVTCLSCGADRARGVPVASPLASTVSGVAGNVATSTMATARPAAPPPMATGTMAAAGFAGGVAAGAVAAVLATGIWYAVVAFSEYQVGFVAALIGWLIGTAVVFGSRKRVGIPLVVVSGLLTVAALVVSEYLIVYHFLTQELGMTVDLIQSPSLVLEIVVESITADPVTLLFWGFAVVASVYIPFKEMQQPVES